MKINWIKFNDLEYYGYAQVNHSGLDEIALCHLIYETVAVPTLWDPPAPWSPTADRQEWTCRVLLGDKIWVSDPGWSLMMVCCDGDPLLDAMDACLKRIHSLTDEIRRERLAARKAQIKQP